MSEIEIDPYNPLKNIEKALKKQNAQHREHLVFIKSSRNTDSIIKKLWKSIDENNAGKIQTSWSI